jgi:pimeloyl-ACP methyl ester carboxylesterase
MSGIGINAQCPGRLTQRLLATVERAHAETGLPVRIVGHSLGGIIGRRAALERPDIISQLIYLGSPVQGVHAHPAVTAMVSLLRTALTTLGVDAPDCLSERCGWGDFLRCVRQRLPDSVQHAAIYTRRDSVVDWHDAQELDPRLNHEVGGTHIGLVYNPRAYRELASLLAEESRLERAA